VRLIPNEYVLMYFLVKPSIKLFLCCPRSLLTRSDDTSDLKNPIAFAGKQINAGEFRHAWVSLDFCLNGNDSKGHCPLFAKSSGQKQHYFLSIFRAIVNWLRGEWVDLAKLIKQTSSSKAISTNLTPQKKPRRENTPGFLVSILG